MNGENCMARLGETCIDSADHSAITILVTDGLSNRQLSEIRIRMTTPLTGRLLPSARLKPAPNRPVASRPWVN
jgi:hypothetical protein